MVYFVTVSLSILIGVATLKVVSFVWYFIRAYLLPKFGFYKDLRKYGEWAVVTGASDGIGKEYAKQLAAFGLNIVLVSRSEDKLVKVAEEINKESKVEVRIIVFDFCNVSEYRKLSSELEGLDIGILVNNVGQHYGDRVLFHEGGIEKMVDIMNVNMISDFRMTHIVLPGMFKRKRGAVVHVTSMAVYASLPGSNVYFSSKIFMKKFAETLQLESEGVIDHQVTTPAHVVSNMSKKKPGLMVPTAKDYVASAIKTIGVVDLTCGFPSHELVFLWLRFTPSWIVSLYYGEVSSIISKKEE